MKKYITTVYFKSGRVETVEADNAPDVDELTEFLNGHSFTLKLKGGGLAILVENVDYIKVEMEEEE